MVNPAGKSAENQAVQFLCRQGYRIIARNYRCPYGEIDVIAEINGIICFIEVKSRKRTDYGFPAAAVNRKKQRHITRAATHYLQHQQLKNESPCRFDVISILPEMAPEIIVNAFQVEK